ncbi:MAG TPA: hypothetical protein DD381_05015 [Lentisphaeria bacterium]|nr:MAG: hypothetical protein A2X47_07655 [Lentisphaerae bacterium GWF2_38_69]HBM15691.1 hypothetical protein [Lentisphaeria bacterium]
MNQSPNKLSNNMTSIPSRAFIRKIDFNKYIAGYFENLSEADRQQYYLYKFIESIIKGFSELRFEAEKYSIENEDRILIRLNKELPISWRRVIDLFNPSSSEPPIELIVQIEQNYKSELLRLVSSPRKILRQFHEKEHLSRVQRIDTKCLTWLIQQPGRNTIEKAGSRQRILAVVKNESYNTLENRVLKKMIEFSYQAAFTYVNDHKDKSSAERYKKVKIFLSELKNIINNPMMVGIDDLYSFPKPNYVLMYDALYNKMWLWYCRLVRQQEETETAWKIQKFLFADWCRLAITVSLMNTSSRKIFSHELWMNNTIKKGSWTELFDWPTEIIISNSLIKIQNCSSDNEDFYNTLKIMTLRAIPKNGCAKQIHLYSCHNTTNVTDSEIINFFDSVVKTAKESSIILYSWPSQRNEEIILQNKIITLLSVNGLDENMSGNTATNLSKIIKGYLAYE